MERCYAFDLTNYRAGRKGIGHIADRLPYVIIQSTVHMIGHLNNTYVTWYSDG